MTPTSADGKTKAQKCKVTRPRSPIQGTKLGFKSRPIRPQSFQLRLSTYPVWSMDPLGSRGWRGLSGGMSGQLRLALHPDQGTSALVKLPNKGGYIPAQVPGTLGICWPSPNKSPPLPARRASTGKGCTGRQTRGEEAPHPHIPLSISELPDDWPAPTFPGPSALGTTSTATSPKPHCQ